MTLFLYDTYTRNLREFIPLKEGEVGLYACGLTVYDFAHIGNLRTYIFEDILRRTLEYNGYRVRHVQNITDVGHLTSDADTGEDKMEKSSRQAGKSAWDIAAFYTQAFKKDLDYLNILEPVIWCRATDHIREQIEFICRLEAKGFTYRTSDGIYFDTSKLPDYGQLALLDVEGLQAGLRIDMGEKRAPTDFALWKFSTADQKRQMEWNSPWGVGFPGWHIECSAMSARYLGTLFDIHCGGEDHIPVHHTNEIAQTQAAYGTNLANFWMHAYHLLLGEDRMSKSSGQFLRLQVLIDKGYDPLTYRFFCLSAHYRSRLSFSWEGLDWAKKSLERLRRSSYEWGSPGIEDAEFLKQFKSYINDDLKMPQAIALVWELAKSDLSPATKKATLLNFDRVLGLRLAAWSPKDETIPEEIISLVEQRTQARLEKRWSEADLIRRRVNELGYEIEDTIQGPRVKKARIKD